MRMKKFILSILAMLLLGAANTVVAQSVGDAFAAEVSALNPRSHATSKVSMRFVVSGIGKKMTCAPMGLQRGLVVTPCIDADATKGLIIVIPDKVNGYNVTGIGPFAFSNCNLYGLSIPSTVTSIGQRAFVNFTGRIGPKAGVLTIPENVTNIGAYAFNGYKTAVTRIDIPESVTSIGTWAFGGMQVDSITVPAGLTSLAAGFAANCPNLTYLNVGEGTSDYAADSNHKTIVNTNTKTLLQSAADGFVPSNVTTVGNYACYGLQAERLLLPAAVKTIGNNAFYRSSLKYVKFPGEVEIGSSAFASNSSLERVDFVDGTVILNNNAFQGCAALEQVYIRPTTTPTLNSAPNAFSGVAEGARLYVPLAQLSYYQTTEPWNTWFDVANIRAYTLIDNVAFTDYDYPQHAKPIDYDVSASDGIDSVAVMYVYHGQQVFPEVGTAEEVFTTINFRAYAKEGYLYQNYPTALLNGSTTLQHLSRANFEEYLQPFFLDSYTTPVPEDGMAVSGSYDFGITEPVVGESPDTSISFSSDGLFTASPVTWTPGDDPFEENTAYVARFRVTVAKDYMYFDENFAPTVNGQPAMTSEKINNSEGRCRSMIVSYSWNYGVRVKLTGDVDLNEEINSADVVSVYKYIVEGDASGINQDDANVDGDSEGNVNSADVVAIYNAIINGSHPVYSINGVNFGMIPVEGGTFQMGSDDGEDNEKPAHSVTLSNYSIGETEVTQALWNAVMMFNPSENIGDNLPVEEVSWKDCQNFLFLLNQAFEGQLGGKVFRLPTEAEWEFAAKGGNQSKGYTYSGSNTLDDVAWYSGNSGLKTHDVATKAPNELGIYDMTGNVYEWCQDWNGSYSSSVQNNPTGPASGSFRINRGGGWDDSDWYCRTAHRNSDTSSFTNSDLGLRLVLGNPIVEAEGVYEVGGVSFKMIAVEGGTFQMGATAEQQDPWDSEKPVHSVTLNSFYIGETEVTQVLWKAVMGDNPSYFRGDNLPVDQVRWNDCQAFITKLNELTGETFRLPTEAEWEFASRGGNKSKGYQYSGSNEVDDVAWYKENSANKTHFVANKQANELGIYDMSGNVYELCQDWLGDYSSSAQTNPTGPTWGSARVARGGSWGATANSCRSAKRYSVSPTEGYYFVGFRLAK